MLNDAQLVVRTEKATIEWLVRHGYRNTLNDYSFCVFIVDTWSKALYGTNTTCMAASGSSGNRPIVLTFAQLKEKLGIEE